MSSQKQVCRVCTVSSPCAVSGASSKKRRCLRARRATGVQRQPLFKCVGTSRHVRVLKHSAKLIPVPFLVRLGVGCRWRGLRAHEELVSADLPTPDALRARPPFKCVGHTRLSRCQTRPPGGYATIPGSPDTPTRQKTRSKSHSTTVEAHMSFIHTGRSRGCRILQNCE